MTSAYQTPPMVQGGRPSLLPRMVELAPQRTRCTVMSVGYNLVLAVLGGATPMAAVYTIRESGYDLSPTALVMAAAAISFFVILKFVRSSEAHKWRRQRGR